MTVEEKMTIMFLSEKRPVLRTEKGGMRYDAKMDICAASGIDFVGLDLLDESELRGVCYIDGVNQDISGKLTDAVEGFIVFAEFHVSRSASGRTIDVSLVSETSVLES